MEGRPTGVVRDLALDVARHTPAGGSPFVTPVPGLTLLRSDRPKPLSHMILRPALCITLQGAKWTAFGERRYEYGSGQALVVSVEMPAVGQVTDATSDRPYLGIVLELDPGVMRSVMEDLDPGPAEADEVQHGVFVSDFDGPLAECVLRIVRLLDATSAIKPLYPSLLRETCYWLLSGPQGRNVARMTLGSERTRRLIEAVHALRERYADKIRVDELAAIARLSSSAFHRQFKALTAMTPVQYQKQLRLFEARRLLASGEVNVETASQRVGYESPSQFSREYSRMFGAPPRRDAGNVRHQAS
jgi:AraC-like DNA-binding protein